MVIKAKVAKAEVVKVRMSSKWKSRKLWVAVGTILSILITEIAGLDIDKEVVLAIVLAAGAYIAGESWIDGRK